MTTEHTKTTQNRSGEGITRRNLLQGMGAGLLLTVLPQSASGQWGSRGDNPIAARVHIGPDGTITVMTGKVEGGQGARTELTQAAAEELQVPPGRVNLIMGDTELVPNDGVTAGSRTTPSTVPAVRRGAAAARDLLVAMAVREWDVDRGTVTVSDGAATAVGVGEKLTYADLGAEAEENPEGPTARALQEEIPDDVNLDAVEEWDALGKSVTRPNGRDIVTGAHRYSSDIARPGMLYGKVLRPPSYRARLAEVDTSVAEEMDDVSVMRDGDFVAVAAPTKHRARQAIDALNEAATWEKTALPPSSEIYEFLRENADEIPQNPFSDAVAAGAESRSATYHAAYIAHAPLETRAGVAEWNDGEVTVWLHTRNPFGCRSELARELGLRVRGEIGPAPLQARDIAELSQREARLCLDNWHNTVSGPLQEVMENTLFVEHINFPGKDNTRTLLDVLRYNRERMREATAGS